MMSYTNLKHKGLKIIKLFVFSIAVFALAEILGNILAILLMLAGICFLFFLPLPFHLHGVIFIIAVAISVVYFKFYEKNLRSRVLYCLFLVVEFLVIVPLVWLFFTSHGHMDIMFNKLLNFPAVIREANNFVEEEKIVTIQTQYGVYTYRSYLNTQKAEYVYEIALDGKVAYSNSIYSYTRKCIKFNAEKCSFVTVPYMFIDLESFETSGKYRIINSENDIKSKDKDGNIVITIFEYSGRGDLSQYKTFVLKEALEFSVKEVGPITSNQVD